MLVNGEQRVDSLNVRVARDGKIRSGLTVAVPDVEVTDGRLQIEFKPLQREPILSAVVVRGKPVADALDISIDTVSDNNYLEELGTGLAVASTTHLSRRGDLLYTRSGWSVISSSG